MNGLFSFCQDMGCAFQRALHGAFGGDLDQLRLLLRRQRRAGQPQALGEHVLPGACGAGAALPVRDRHLHMVQRPFLLKGKPANRHRRAFGERGRQQVERGWPEVAAALVNRFIPRQPVAGHLDAILDSIEDGVFIADRDGYALKANAAYEQLTGMSKAELIGKNVEELKKELG